MTGHPREKKKKKSVYLELKNVKFEMTERKKLLGTEMGSLSKYA